MTREFTALGSKVVESNVAFKGPEDEQDFWEGEKFEGEHNQRLGPDFLCRGFESQLVRLAAAPEDVHIVCSSMPLDVVPALRVHETASALNKVLR